MTMGELGVEAGLGRRRAGGQDGCRYRAERQRAADGDRVHDPAEERELGAGSVRQPTGGLRPEGDVI